MNFEGCEHLVSDLEVFLNIYKKYQIIKKEFTYNSEGCIFMTDGLTSEIYKNGNLIGMIKDNKMDITDGSYTVKNNIVAINGITLKDVLKQRFNIELQYNYNEKILIFNEKYKVKVDSFYNLNIIKFSLHDPSTTHQNTLFYDLEKMEVIGVYKINKTYLSHEELMANIFAGVSDKFFFQFNYKGFLINNSCLKIDDYYICLNGASLSCTNIIEQFYELSANFNVYKNGELVLYCESIAGLNKNMTYNLRNKNKEILITETNCMSVIDLVNKYGYVIKNPNVSYHPNGALRYDGSKYYTKEGVMFDLAPDNYKALKHLSDEQIYGMISNVSIIRPTTTGSSKRIRVE